MVLANSEKCKLLLVGGEIGSGKSSVAKRVVDQTPGARLVRVRDVLGELLAGARGDRNWLQTEGARLERQTRGRWLLHYLEENCDHAVRWEVDAARTRSQVEPIIENWPGSILVFLAASVNTRRLRFEQSRVSDPVKQSMPFELAVRHNTEAEARTISAMAHVVLDTDDMTLDEVVEVVVSHCGWAISA